MPVAASGLDTFTQAYYKAYVHSGRSAPGGAKSQQNTANSIITRT